MGRGRAGQREGGVTRVGQWAGRVGGGEGGGCAVG